MRCKKCGKDIPNDSKFCQYCQAPISEQERREGEMEADRVRCPHCGSTNLDVISDVRGKGVDFWKLCCCGFFGLCGAGDTHTEHFWLCKNCGTKFKI